MIKRSNIQVILYHFLIPSPLLGIYTFTQNGLPHPVVCIRVLSLLPHFLLRVQAVSPSILWETSTWGLCVVLHHYLPPWPPKRRLAGWSVETLHEGTPVSLRCWDRMLRIQDTNIVSFEDIYSVIFFPLKFAFTTSWCFLGKLDIVVLAFIDGQMNSCHLTV